MNVNFGLFPPAPAPDPSTGRRKLKGRDRKRAQAERALAALDGWLNPSRAAAE
jgi:methylenetetrahydrofolate--tRNA-(uracil-5-)-methyltransferase